MKTLVFGHKNPDTDSVCSAIAYATFKNLLGEECEPRVLGNINLETSYVLDTFGIQPPKLLKDVKVQVKDLSYEKCKTVQKDASFLKAYKIIQENNISTIAVVTEENTLEGIVTIKDIAMELIQGDFYQLSTYFHNVVKELNANVLYAPQEDFFITGQIAVVAEHYKPLMQQYTHKNIVITGDVFETIELLIENRVQLIIVNSTNRISEYLVMKAKESNIPIIQTSLDTYNVARIMQQCNTIASIMKNENIKRFPEKYYADEVKEEILATNYRNYPVVDEKGKFLGFLSRRHLLKGNRKNVILVDHNEESQSVLGLEEAQILEILDHHKIGGLQTIAPIKFMNVPVGSTCTIVYMQFVQNNVVIPEDIAGILMSGILSDTLCFKSPTCTAVDIDAAKKLSLLCNKPYEEHFKEMYRAASSTQDLSIEEIINYDFKELSLGKYKVGIGQFFSSDIDSIMEQLDEYLNYMNKKREEKNYDMLLFVNTDILLEGSYIFYVSDHPKIISNAFELDEEQGRFVPTIVSRKKQIIPMLNTEVEKEKERD